MRRILVTGLTENPGGVESYFINLHRHLDHKKLKFDLIKHTDQPLAYEDELKAAGGTVFFLSGRRKNPLLHHRDYQIFFRRYGSRYDGIYCNLLSLANIDDLKFARRYGIPLRIAHAHNNGDDAVGFRRLRAGLHRFHQNVIDQYATKWLACSESAGKWMFGNHSFEVIPNSIDLSRFHYCGDMRKKMRARLGLSDHTLVLGTAGRLAVQKNPLFLIDIFKAVHNRFPDSVFLHLGDGPLRQEMEQAIRNSLLGDHYLLLGNQEKVEQYYLAMDAFLFPSLYEGLGISLVEAQAMGLHCFISAGVPHEAVLVDELCHRMASQASADQWADAILRKRPDFLYRPDPSPLLRQKGYDIKTEAFKIQTLLLEEG